MGSNKKTYIIGDGFFPDEVSKIESNPILLSKKIQEKKSILNKKMILEQAMPDDEATPAVEKPKDWTYVDPQTKKATAYLTIDDLNGKISNDTLVYKKGTEPFKFKRADQWDEIKKEGILTPSVEEQPSTTTATNTQTTESTNFPPCVSGFAKSPQGFPYSLDIRDDAGTSYRAVFTARERQGGFFAGQLFKDSQDTEGQPIRYRCEGTFVFIEDLNLKRYYIGAQKTQQSTNQQSTGQQTQQAGTTNPYLDAVKAKNAVLGIKLFLDEKKLTLDEDEIDEIAHELEVLITNNHRGKIFKQFESLLRRLKSMYETMGESYKPTVDFLNDTLTDYQQYVTNANNSELAKKMGLTDWDVYANPGQMEMGSYGIRKISSLDTQPPVYRLKGELMGKTKDIDILLQQYQDLNKVDKQSCNRYLDDIMSSASESKFIPEDQKKKLFKKKYATTGEGFAGEKLQALKQAVANCAKVGMLDNREDELKVITSSEVTDEFRVARYATNSIQQPKAKAIEIQD